MKRANASWTIALLVPFVVSRPAEQSFGADQSFLTGLALR
jgi:hypothetical protein